MINVLVVCHGNICRSPLCAAVLKKELGKECVRSGGFAAPNKPAAKKVRDYAITLGYDLSSHRSRNVTLEDTEWADEVIYMDGGNLTRLEDFTPAAGKEQCLAWYVERERIPDPNYIKRGPELDAVLEMIVRASLALAERIRHNKKAPHKQG